MTSFSENRALLNQGKLDAPKGASRLGRTSPEKVISVSIIVRRKSPLNLAELDGQVSRAEYLDRFAANPADFDRIKAFAESHGLRVDETASSQARRTIVLCGSAGAMEQAFGVTLYDYGGTVGEPFHTYIGGITLPEELIPLVKAVLGLDNRPAAEPNFVQLKDLPPEAVTSSFSYYASDIATYYFIPASGSGVGQTIAIIELGGGYYESDIKAYFSKIGHAVPSIVSVSVDGGQNNPGVDTNSDTEVALDIQVAGGIAYGARIAVYFAPNTLQGFIDAITTATHDTSNTPSVISISWGGSETDVPSSLLACFDDAIQSAGALGITVTVASGDKGSTNGQSKNTVQYPACCPHALACGGTRIAAHSGAITNETVWNDSADSSTGGGVSTVFPMPEWQTGCCYTPTGGNATLLSGRGVPDVAGDASPASGYNIIVNGHWAVVGGTSAVSPLWAALIGVCNQLRYAWSGFVNPTFYNNGIKGNTCFRSITQGNNGGYQASGGWNACTGFGAPYGIGVAALLGIAGGASSYPTVSALKVKNDMGAVIDIHALYRNPTVVQYTEVANKDNFPIAQSRTMSLKCKCTDPAIEPGDIVQCKVWVMWGDDNTCQQIFLYDPNGPTQDFKISGGTKNNTLAWEPQS